jgi:hypothetical protein
MSNAGSLPRHVEPADLGPGVTGGAGAETPPAAPQSLAERKAALLAMLDVVEAEERAADPAPLALAVKRADRMVAGINQRTGKPWGMA